MGPHKAFGHHPDGPAREQVGQGPIVLHSRKDRLHRCTLCGKTFSRPAQIEGAMGHQTKLQRIPTHQFVLLRPKEAH